MGDKEVSFFFQNNDVLETKRIFSSRTAASLDGSMPALGFISTLLSSFPTSLFQQLFHRDSIINNLHKHWGDNSKFISPFF